MPVPTFCVDTQGMDIIFQFVLNIIIKTMKKPLPRSVSLGENTLTGEGKKS